MLRKSVAVVSGLMVAATLALTGCGSSTGAKTAAKPVIYNLEPYIFPYVTANDKGINLEAKKLGLKVAYANAQGSDTAEISQIHDAITAHAAGIVIQAVDSVGMVSAVKQAIKAGIPVVAMTVNLGTKTGAVYPGTKGYVGWNEHYSGALAADALAKLIGGKGDVAILIGALTNGASRAREQGARAEWAKHWPHVHVVAFQQYQFNLNTARSDVLDLISRYGPQLKGIFIDTNPGSVAAIRAINTTALKDKVAITSVGGERAFNNYISQGYPAADIPEAPVSEGEEAVKLLYQAMHGNHKPVDFLEQNLPAVKPLAPYHYTITKADVKLFHSQW